jgi:alpha-ketoglutaric semialdehyde dehydrogenase
MSQPRTSLVAGRPAPSGGATFHAMAPSSGALLAPPFASARAADVAAAATAAGQAAPALRRTEPATRAALLDAIAAGLETRGAAIVARAGAETALPEARLTGELGRTTAQLRMFAALVREGSWVDARIDRALPTRTPAPRPDLRRLLVPVGPVAVFGAGNFPLAFSVAGGDTAAALAAGCPVVVKAHPGHPGTSALVGEVVAAAVAATPLPGGVFSLLHGPEPAVGLALVRHPAIRAVAFTGSLAGGRALFDAAATRPEPIPVFAEMGSVNPVFLLPGALAARGPSLAAALVASITLGVGQFCTKPGVLCAVRGPSLDAFRAAAAAAVAAVPPASMLTAATCERLGASTAAALAIPGVRVVARGPAAAGTHQGAAAVLLETDAATFAAHPELADERFGPVALLVVADSVAGLDTLAAALPGQLTATLHAEPDELAAAASLIAHLEERVGRLLFGGVPTGVEVTAAMQHGGPYPATTDSRGTSVGTAAILRFVRPLCYQDAPAALLPPELQDRNHRGIWRLVDGHLTRDDLEAGRPEPRAGRA